MPRRVQNLLEKIGDERILRIQLGRTPVDGVILKLLDFLSDSKFSNKQLELGYDEIYHNYLLVTFENSNKPTVLQHMLGPTEQSMIPSTVLKLEKAQRIALKPPAIPDELNEVYDIPLSSIRPLTLNRLISVASNVDKNFYNYDAGENNMCQTFVENIIEINGLTPNIDNQATLEALKPQDSKALISTLGSRSNIVKTVTDLGAKLDKLVFDHRVKWKKSASKQYAFLDYQDNIDPDNIDKIYDSILHLEQSGKKNKYRNFIIFPVRSCSMYDV